MISKRYRHQIEGPLAGIAGRVPLTQLVGEINKFGIVLKGGFYLPEKWDGGDTYWLNREGEILIDCPLPEALVKLSFLIIPSKRADYPALTLVASQGTIALRQDVISKPELYNLYISLLEGVNPIRFLVEGEILSPQQIGGLIDGRKLSFAFQDIKVELLA